MKEVSVGIIGGGLMGREMASAFARWCALVDFPVKPRLTYVADLSPGVLKWFTQNVDGVTVTTDYNNPHFPALRADALALSGASRRKQFPSSKCRGSVHSVCALNAKTTFIMQHINFNMRKLLEMPLSVTSIRRMGGTVDSPVIFPNCQ